MRKFFASRAQTIGEYTIMVGLVLAAILAMQVYMQRILQSRYRAANRYLANQIGSPITQYEPYYAQSNFTVEQQSNIEETHYGRIGTDRSKASIEERRGEQNVLPGSATNP